MLELDKLHVKIGKRAISFSPEVTLHSLALLMQDNKNLRIAKERNVKKRTRSTNHLPYEEGLTVEEALQLAAQLGLLVEEDRVESHAEVELPSQPNGPAARAPSRCMYI